MEFQYGARSAMRQMKMLTGSTCHVLHIFVSPALPARLTGRIPNFILLAVPATLEPSSLNTMIAFATGGLLGDVFLHLVPHSFFGEGCEGGHSTIMVEPKRNIVIGLVTKRQC
jgi:zinc transporter 7